MSRRKNADLTAVEQATKAATKEFGLPASDWRIEMFVTTTVGYWKTRQEWTEGKAKWSDVAAVMQSLVEQREAIQKAKATDATTISVNIVEHAQGTYCCEFCGKRNFLKAGTYEPLKRPAALPAPDKPAPEPAATSHDSPEAGHPESRLQIANQKPPAPAVTHDPSRSPSPFHNAVINGVTAPLKRLQPSPFQLRKLSPLSQ